MKKSIKCSKCGNKISPYETKAYLKAKRVCQICYGRRNNKGIKGSPAWWKKWVGDYTK